MLSQYTFSSFCICSVYSVFDLKTAFKDAIYLFLKKVLSLLFLSRYCRSNETRLGKLSRGNNINPPLVYQLLKYKTTNGIKNSEETVELSRFELFTSGE